MNTFFPFISSLFTISSCTKRDDSIQEKERPKLFVRCLVLLCPSAQLKNWYIVWSPHFCQFKRRLREAASRCYVILHQSCDLDARPSKCFVIFNESIFKCCYIKKETNSPTFTNCHMCLGIFGDSASTDTKHESVGCWVVGEVVPKCVFLEWLVLGSFIAVQKFGVCVCVCFPFKSSRESRSLRSRVIRESYPVGSVVASSTCV